MKIRSPKDFWSGLFFIAVALGFIGLSQQYGMGNMHRMGPALFPTLVGVLLAGLGLVIALRAFAIDGRRCRAFHARPIIVSLAAIALFGVALQLSRIGRRGRGAGDRWGCASSESRALENLGLALALIAFSVAVFVWLLGLPIPLWPEA